MLEKIVSGGDTGVDRAALDVARELGVACGGWCPRGRVADDGRIGGYRLRETPSANYLQCTEWNVRDSHGTLLLTRGRPTGGVLKTLHYALQLHHRNETRRVPVLNVAGPRERKRRGIYRDARRLLLRVLPR